MALGAGENSALSPALNESIMTGMNDLMQLAYDDEADVLLRVDPDTGDVVGLTILNLATCNHLANLSIHVDLHALSG
jgi:hypothetical protein